jgi:hypothetical protein
MLPFYLCPFGNKWYAFLFTHLINPFLCLNENMNAVYLFNEVYLDLELRQPRLEGEEYLAFMEAVPACWPKAVVQVCVL